MENNWIPTFPKGISAMWNAISLVQDLNLCHRVHFQWRYPLHHGHLHLTICLLYCDQWTFTSRTDGVKLCICYHTINMGWLVGWLVVGWLGFYGISTFEGYLKSISVYIFNLRFLNEYFADNILDKQDLIYLLIIKWFQFIKFFGTTLSYSRRIERHPFFSLHSMRMCLMAQDIWHVKHCGWLVGRS